MSLQLILGAAKSGKTTYIYDQMMRESMASPDREFFFLVPDQSTLSAQKELVTRHPAHGTMNIDVVGFFRLAYRVFEELSYIPQEILEDEGKSMVLRKVLDENKNRLSVYGKSSDKEGFLDEMKSFFSELYQYDISKEMFAQVMDSLQEESLGYKLADIFMIFNGFEEEIHGRYLASEQLLDVFARKIFESEKLRDATFYLDGFTGFTPVQRKVIDQLMLCAQKVVISFTVEKEALGFAPKEYELFELPKNEIMILKERAESLGVKVEHDLVLDCACSGSKELHHLERNLFRYPNQSWEEKPVDLKVIKALNPRQEARIAAHRIAGLVRREHYRYRDILVFTGDEQTYRPELERSFEDLSIPFFFDGNRKLTNNPCVETISSALKMIQKDFSYDMVFRYLKSGYSCLTGEETDHLENYVIAMGIRGFAAWNRPFVKGPFSKESIEKADQQRIRFMDEISQLKEAVKKRGGTVRDKLTALYDFFLKLDLQNKIEKQRELFEQEGLAAMAKTYGQVFQQMIALMEQMDDILGDQVISYEHFCDIFETGLAEMTVGVIPPGPDQVLAGDMTRTRYEGAKVLFFLGVNEGLVPKPAAAGHMITDTQRQRLCDLGMTLAPTVTKNTYTQQYYLYLAMSKPESKLYLSYAAMDAMGDAKEPSYVIGRIRKIFPLMQEEDLSEHWEFHPYTPNEARELFVEKLQQLDGGSKEKDLGALYHALSQWMDVSRYLNARFYKNETGQLDESLAESLYGEMFKTSVTRMELFSSCPFAHFLKYGLKLKKRLEHQVLPTDTGSIFHKTMELVGTRTGWKWDSDQERDDFVEQCVDDAIDEISLEKLSQSARDTYTIDRIKRIAKRSVWAVQQHMIRGEFKPYEYEAAFSRGGLSGVADRVDRYDEDENLFVKIVDYKSGSMKMDYAKIIHGLQLQLVVYMNAIIAVEREKHPNRSVLPAGIFYFHLDDPMISERGDEIENEAALLKALEMSGTANEDFGLVEKIEQPDEHGFLSMAVKMTKAGYSKNSPLLSSQEFENMGDYVEEKTEEIRDRIMEGEISISPYEYKQESSCTYCDFRNVCGFEKTWNKARTLSPVNTEEAKKIFGDEEGTS